MENNAMVTKHFAMCVLVVRIMNFYLLDTIYIIGLYILLDNLYDAKYPVILIIVFPFVFIIVH